MFTLFIRSLRQFSHYRTDLLLVFEILKLWQNGRHTQQLNASYFVWFTFHVIVTQ